ncbi:hypothetical protein THAOC_20315 [Thalassiosira oceanica]|uniref:Uncharacterized protein n=1 Tax=Thalassiosira oceanica TaxID=159749 RepID=K0S021_THAOC|nr:hypothetical protein THAOC_20315 [Thalassiosira oceanica]|mmetsp:Transcript_39315/g.94145  ORF Transcript_39315/g.94145 Transcript_39315/m.94145 type:complete len:109 (+) Transcript_39315:205-531(+)|eukprot:EJK59458.1 hypothetical protein THAOC_20315 [Thalassiosira oceanica]
MSGRASAVLRAISRTSHKQLDNHRSVPFRISSPSVSKQSIHIDSISRTLSKRALHSTSRSQTSHYALRSALAMEFSSLRYALLLESEAEDGLLMGWDSGVDVEDEDGT